ncbi:MAG: hypothetical protein D3923_11000, partial [Candidatus Electrothrix sp. AR3]|nr:hypothetical protein [Candidatus Electrothrix sp. AR3]
MSRGQISRGDLLRAALRYDGQLPADTAEALGFLPQKIRTKKQEAIQLPSAAPGNAEQIGETVQAVPRNPLLPVPFWQPQEFSREETATQSEKTGQVSAALPSRIPKPPPPYQYLAEFNDLVPRLRAALSEHRPSRSPDIPQIIDRLSQAEILSELPQLHRPGWGSSLYVL